MPDIKERYGKFGPAVVEQVRVELNRHGDLKTILKRLDVQVPEELDQQHEALTKLITRYGPLFFMTVAKSDWTTEQVRGMMKKLKAGVDTPLPGTLKRLTPKSITPLPGKKLGLGRDPEPPEVKSPAPPPPAKPPAPEPPLRRMGAERMVVQPRSPYSAPSKNRIGSNLVRPTEGASSQSLPPVSPVSKGGWIEVPGYRGPDRRVRGERRVGPPDRRLTTEMIMKNKRYGGKDRRKVVRRAADRQKNG